MAVHQTLTVTAAATAAGWSATVTHTALDANEGCAIYYGDATAPTIGSATPQVEGQIVCTR